MRWKSGLPGPSRSACPLGRRRGDPAVRRDFGLETLPETHDHNDMPKYPPGHHHFNLTGTKLVKQADVVMLTYVLPDYSPTRSSAPITTTISR